MRFTMAVVALALAIFAGAGAVAAAATTHQAAVSAAPAIGTPYD
ncbi:hypothetical protein [Kutzneria buriramensis]|uniref:Uncharacterized protein n=1 Tax=Kutzneria buriramensis TaxID=1045776 RepID=A0A3E0I0B0_9PSEU|nr:hypothetical protein [Kutzneria buriramensis]REH52133.1 hypothetical protein BCF44_103584 [Kutzneria buriramensis]